MWRGPRNISYRVGDNCTQGQTDNYYTEDGYTLPTRVCVMYENGRQMYARNGQIIRKIHKKQYLYFHQQDVVFDRRRSAVANQGSPLDQLHTHLVHAQLNQQDFA